MSLVKGNVYLKRFSIFFKTVRQYRSVLYLTGNRATDTCAVVTPQIDVDKLLKNVETLEDSVKRRGCDVNVSEMSEIWKFISMMKDTMKILEDRKMILFDTIKEIKSNDANSETEIEKLRIHTKILKDDLKAMKHALLPIQENFMLNILSLPNSIHHKTPNGENFQIDKFGEVPRKSEKSHIEIGTELDILNFSGPYNYYLKKDAAVFELCAKFYFSERLRNFGYVQFSNPDFMKSAIVEGCGLDYTNPNEIFILHQNEDAKVNEMRLHLTGGGSLFAFIAYHARNVVIPKMFPLRYFCMGRQYKPVPENSDKGLFQVSQASVVEIFVATKDCEKEANIELEKILNEVTEIYKAVGYHLRTSYCPVENLLSSESLRISFEMFSSHLNCYIEVGYISVSDNYISKRLQFSYKEKEDHFPKIISGTILNVPKLLGCVLENNVKDHFQFPDVLKNIF